MDFFQHPRCNKVFNPAPGDEEKVRPLPVAVGHLEGGSRIICSFWKPDKDDLAILLAGGHLVISMLTPNPPPPVLLEARRD